MNSRADSLEKILPPQLAASPVQSSISRLSASELLGLADAFLAKGDYDNAVAHFEEALRLQPDLEGVYNNLGAAWLQLENFAKAADCFQKALQSPLFS